MTAPLREGATRRRSWVRIGGILAAATGLTLGAGELFARRHLGLGTPALMIADSELEYRYLPDQDVMRFGNRIFLDSLGMRSAGPAAGTEAAGDAFRVLVLGDSVINGGSLTDHEELATTLLQRSLKRRLGRPVWVGNASAVSWGPENLLAFVKRHSALDADVTVVQVAAHDIEDVRRFRPLTASQPTRTPYSAVWEGVTRYLPTRLSGRRLTAGKPSGAVGWNPEDRRASESAMRDLLRILGSEAPVVVLYQAEFGESRKTRNLEAKAAFAALAAEGGFPFVDMSPGANDTKSLYRDSIHPSAEGQRRIAEMLTPIVLEYAPSRIGHDAAGYEPAK